VVLLKNALAGVIQLFLASFAVCPLPVDQNNVCEEHYTFLEKESAPFLFKTRAKFYSQALYLF